jgi:hypothetical protein
VIDRTTGSNNKATIIHPIKLQEPATDAINPGPDKIPPPTIMFTLISIAFMNGILFEVLIATPSLKKYNARLAKIFLIVQFELFNQKVAFFFWQIISL